MVSAGFPPFFLCSRAEVDLRIRLISLSPERGEAGGGVACPLPIGGEMERAQKRAGRKRSERAQGVANEEESEVHV